MPKHRSRSFRGWSYVRVFASILIFISEPGVAKEYKLMPLVGLGPPVDEGVTVAFESPNGWQPWTKMNDTDDDFVRVFALPGHADEEHPAIQLSVEAWVPGKLFPGPNKPIDLKDPRNSSTATDMETAAPIEAVRKIGSFDSGENGSLPIWQIHSKAYDCLLVLVVHQHTSVDISLRGTDANSLKKYIADLKKVARSVRFDGLALGTEKDGDQTKKVDKPAPASSPKAAITPHGKVRAALLHILANGHQDSRPG